MCIRDSIINVRDKKSENGKEQVLASHILLKVEASPATLSELRRVATLFSYDAQDSGFTVAANSNNLAIINNENLDIFYDEISRAEFDDDGKLIKTADLFFLGGGKNVSKSRSGKAIFIEAESFDQIAAINLKAKSADTIDKADVLETVDINSIRKQAKQVNYIPPTE